MKLTTITFLMAACIYSGTTTAQTYCGLVYHYDAGGNRIKREVIPPADCGLPPWGGGTHGKHDVNETPATLTEPEAESLTVTFSPNPTTTVLNVTFSSLVTEVEITIYDNSGRKLYFTKAGGANTPLDVSGYASGVYFVSVKAGKRLFRSKFIKD